MQIVDVLIFRGVPSIYSYKNPFEEPLLGHIVDIPFGRGACKGLVVNSYEGEGSTKLKPIFGLTKNKAVIGQDLIDFIHWFHTHYQCSPYKAFQTIIGAKSIRKLDEPDAINIKEPEYELSEDQKSTLAEIFKHDENFQEFYIRGVTGSGKTEIYMQLAATLLKKGKSTILLVPEIALTPQYTRIFTERFGSVISVIHSGLTPKQRDIEWNRINRGHATLIIGPRSAVFAPAKNLGLIIVDEEHEPSYKQDSHPRYATHKCVEFRAKYHEAWLVYGSATPRVETFARFQDEKKAIFELNTRVSGNPLPSVELIDMAEAMKEKSGGLITHQLEAAIKDRLEKKEKVMILINRRGFSTFIICQKCQTIHECSQCGLSYTYHQDRTFRCHRCGIVKGVTHTCKSCKSNRLGFSGVGIQKVELEIQRLFPFANTLRLDRDTAKTMKEMENILDEFRSSGDILIGTQLIAKGHHIETVTLVAVLGIDTTLNLPDFRSTERSFQLITQVAGRAGRGDKPGHVIVQTLQPEHPAIEHASKHDFHAFFKEEISYRDCLGYPPFKELIHIIISSKEEKELQAFCKVLDSFLIETFKTLDVDSQRMGPKPAPIERVRDHHRWDVVIKCEKENLKSIKDSFLAAPKPPKSVRLMFDYDPYSLL